MVKIFLPAGSSRSVKEILEEQNVCRCLELWEDSLSNDQQVLTMLVSAEQTEGITDLFQEKLGGIEGARLLLLPVEATLPRPEEPEKTSPETVGEEEAEANAHQRFSREELYADITEAARLNRTFLLLVVFSTVVAAIGLVGDNVAVIIGAMVIAPLLGPNVALSLATTLGDLELGIRSLRVNAAGVATALLFSLAAGLLMDVPVDSFEISSRTRADFGDIMLALVSGGAGALSFTVGISTALVGVMVAVALLPPLVTFGMLLSAGYWEPAWGALLLTFINLICINLAGVVTFLLQGIRPHKWWEADRAKKAVRIAILLWILLLTALAMVVLIQSEETARGIGTAPFHHAARTSSPNFYSVPCGYMVSPSTSVAQS